MSNLPQLLPMPRAIALADGAYPLQDHRLIVVDCRDPQAMFFAARRLQMALRRVAGLTWEIVASTALPRDQIGVVLTVASGAVRHPQGYELSITPEGICRGS